MLHKIIKGVAPLAAMALAAGLAGCDGVNVRVGETDGVPLSELDMTGAAPTRVVLAGPDKVVLATGETLTIDVDGDADAVDALRFNLEDGTLAIMRDHEAGDVEGYAMVSVVMPPAEEIVIAGSGELETDGLASTAELVIAGSGRAKVANAASEMLEVSLNGSGSLEAAGTVERLELNIRGSGSAPMTDLKVKRAELNITGSGNAAFASDGTVEANVVGSGDVEITGSAKCEVNAVGSGRVRCQAAPDTAAPENESEEA